MPSTPLGLSHHAIFDRQLWQPAFGQLRPRRSCSHGMPWLQMYWEIRWTCSLNVYKCLYNIIFAQSIETTLFRHEMTVILPVHASTVGSRYGKQSLDSTSCSCSLAPFVCLLLSGPCTVLVWEAHSCIHRMTYRFHWKIIPLSTTQNQEIRKTGSKTLCWPLFVPPLSSLSPSATVLILL